MFSLRNKRRLMKKSVNLNKYGPFFIIFPLPVMLKFTVLITAVHLFTCVAKAVTSRRSREYVENTKHVWCKVLCVVMDPGEHVRAYLLSLKILKSNIM